MICKSHWNLNLTRSCDCCFFIFNIVWAIYSIHSLNKIESFSKLSEIQDDNNALFQGCLALYIDSIFQLCKYICLCCCITVIVTLICVYHGPQILEQVWEQQRVQGSPQVAANLYDLMLRGGGIAPYAQQWDENQTVCSICIVDFEGEDETMTLPCQGWHKFHSECLRTWFHHKTICPMCHENITPELIG